jgi:hypothetical protein
VREGQTALVERALELAAVVPGLDRGGQRQLVDLDDPRHLGHVDHDAPGVGHRRAHHAGAAAARHHGDAVLAGEAQRGRDLLIGPRAYDDIGQRRAVLLRRVQRGPRPVARCPGPVLEVGRRGTDRGAQVVDERSCRRHRFSTA